MNKSPNVPKGKKLPTVPADKLFDPSDYQHKQSPSTCLPVGQRAPTFDYNPDGSPKKRGK